MRFTTDRIRTIASSESPPQLAASVMREAAEEIDRLRAALIAEEELRKRMGKQLVESREVINQVQRVRDRLADRLAETGTIDPGFPDAHRDAVQRAQAYRITLDDLDAVLDGKRPLGICGQEIATGKPCEKHRTPEELAALGGIVHATELTGNWMPLAALDDVPDHEFVGVAAHPDDDECTYRADGTDETYCGLPASAHQDGTDKRTWEDPAGDVRQAMDEAYADGEGVIEFPDLTEPAQRGYGVIHEGGPDE